MLENAAYLAARNLKQRFIDWCRERRIRQLTETMVACAGRRHTPEIQALWDRLKGEILARSPEQIARMEKRMGARHA